MLAPLKGKSAKWVTHALVTHLFCPFSTPHVIISDNGAEFRNAIAAEISAQFQITQTFKTAYHPAANGLAEKATELLNIIRSLVNELHDNWEDWLPQITATIMSSVYVSSSKSHYTLYEVGKRLPYDLLINTPQPVYNIEGYAQQLIHVFSTIHINVCEKLMATKAKMLAKQLKRATPVKIKQTDTVMIQ